VDPDQSQDSVPHLPEGSDPRRAARRIIAVGGGKGGAGKSLLAANLGIFLSTLGKRVVLLDADLGGANLHTFVGVERPRVTLGDLFEKRVARVEDVVVETPIPGLGLVSGEGDPSWIANPRPAQKFRLLNQVQQLDVDYLVVDLGPGSGINAIDFFLVADVGVLVVVPEPTSVENTYRFLKSAFLRRLKRAGIEPLTLPPHAYEGGVPGPLDLYLAARDRDEAMAARLLAEMQAFRPRIVVNQVRTKSDVELGPALAAAARRRLGLAIDDLGHLEADDAVWLAVRKRRPLLVEHPESRVAKGIERVTRRLLAMEQERPASSGGSGRAPSEPTHYEVLDIDPAATDEEIRRAHRRTREIYSHDSLVVCGLYDRERLSAFHLRIEEAYDTLMDAERRRAYDLALFPEGLPRKRVGAGVASGGVSGTGPLPISAASESRGTDGEAGRKLGSGLHENPALALHSTPPAGVSTGPNGAPAASAPATEFDDAAPTVARTPPPEIILEPGAEVTGPVLRRLREARGVDLHTISQKTKIGIGHLRAIEDERFDLMPAVVYVRGFLVEYAKFLRLDVKRVLDTYLERYKGIRAELDGERG
jgi:flagellar biosynthesis protein FlhG